MGTDGRVKHITLLGDEASPTAPNGRPADTPDLDMTAVDTSRTDADSDASSLEVRTRLYALALTALAIATVTGLWLAGYQLRSPVAVLALCAVAAIAERGSVRLGKTTEQSISLLPTLFAAVTFSPLAAALVGGSSMLGDPELRDAAPGRKPLLKLLTYGSSRSIAGAAAGLTATFAQHNLAAGFGGVALASISGAIVAEAIDVGGAATTARVRRTRSIRDVLETHIPLVLTSAPLFAPVVAALTVAYSVSPWTMPLFFGPALAAQQLFGLYQEQRRLTDDLTIANETLSRVNMSFAAALVATLDARDRYTAGHSAAVAIYSRDIAARMGFDAEVQEKAYLCGLVHDIGKIGLPPGLLEKPGALTLEERRQMQEHSEIGERILANVEAYADVALIVRHHHERVDGQGYPDGLSDAGIPLISRIIAVADAYNAMTSDRPYRDAMPSRIARHRLAQAVQSQFDTAVVAAFEAILAGADESYRVALREDFSELRAWYGQSEPVAGAA